MFHWTPLYEKCFSKAISNFKLFSPLILFKSEYVQLQQRQPSNYLICTWHFRALIRCRRRHGIIFLTAVPGVSPGHPYNSVKQFTTLFPPKTVMVWWHVQWFIMQFNDLLWSLTFIVWYAHQVLHCTLENEYKMVLVALILLQLPKRWCRLTFLPLWSNIPLTAFFPVLHAFLIETSGRNAL